MERGPLHRPFQVRHSIEVCPHGALTPGDDDKPKLDRSRCGDCDMPGARACPSQGLIVYGQKRTVGDVLDRVEQDMAFYARSGGGMTLSGGEPPMGDVTLDKSVMTTLQKTARGIIGDRLQVPH